MDNHILVVLYYLGIKIEIIRYQIVFINITLYTIHVKTTDKYEHDLMLLLLCNIIFPKRVAVTLKAILCGFITQST